MKSNLKRISNGEMPPANKYILIYAGNRPWHDRDDQKNVYWKVAKCIYGISMEQRTILENSENISDRYRASIFRTGDEFGNNLVPYCFEEFGPDSYFGNEIDVWMPLPEI